MKPLYIFDIDGTLALIEHRRHFVERRACQACSGFGSVKRDPLEVTQYKGTLLPVLDPCKACGGTAWTTANWPAFYAACVDDVPNMPVINTMAALRAQGAEVWLFSGRSDEVRDKTVEWLFKHTDFTLYELETALMMRKAGDYTADHVLKKQWLDQMLFDDRERLVAVFDDRDRVVKMWRDNWVACFQVAKGEF